MRRTLMYRPRIIATLVNSTLDYDLLSNSRSGHFTELRSYVPHEQEFHGLPAGCETSNVYCFAMQR